MKNTKKILSVGVALILAMTSFAGCAKAKPKVVATTAPKEITIHYAHWIAENDTKGMDTFNKVAADFKKLNPNITVVLDTQPTNKADDYVKKYDLLLLSGDKTDIINTKSLADYATRAKKNLFVPMTNFIKQDKLKMTDFLVDTTQGGVVYGLPWNVTSSLVLINKDYLDQAGLKVPALDWTWDDYASYAKQMTKVTGKTTRYGSIAPFWGDPVYYYMGVMQVKLDNPLFKDEKTTNFEDPVLKGYLQLKYNMEQVDKSEVSFLEYNAAKLNYASEFFKGNAAMVSTGNFSFPAVTDTAINPHTFKTVVAMAPRWKDSPKGLERGDATMSSINKNIDADHQAAAYKFIKYYAEKGALASGQIPAYKNINYDTLVTSITGAKPELWDVDSLKAYLNNKDRKENVAVTVPEKDATMKAILKEEADKYFSKGQTLDKAIENMVKRASDEMKK